MNIQGLDLALCEKRNRIVARKEAVEGVPVRLLAGSKEDFRAAIDGYQSEVVGELPETLEKALSLINAKLPEGATELTADDVYVHYLEAANSNFIGDRYMFLGESTLRNIASDAEKGFAFMNSHRTGSLSQPSELPFGKTFAGQFQMGTDADGKPQKRAIVAFYMLRSVKPNGESGPTTDDLHKMIVGGQVEDVSVGLSGGDAICDVCAVNVRETSCPHAPGTHRAMTDAEIEAQTKREVPGGKCSYTLNDARCGEVSAVFNGAVPGAGIKKVMSLRQKGKLNHREWKEARSCFGSLLTGDISMDTDLFDEVAEAVESGVSSALGKHAEALVASAITTQGVSMAEQTVAQQSADSAVVTAEVEAKLKAELEAKLKADYADRIAALEADKNDTELKVKQASERIAQMEAAARRSRFEAEVKGRAESGVEWFGDHGKHIAFLERLAEAFGAESDEVLHYCHVNRAYAAQAEKSALFGSIGSEKPADQATLSERVAAKAQQLRDSNSQMTQEQAETAVFAANPELYSEYLKQGGR